MGGQKKVTRIGFFWLLFIGIYLPVVRSICWYTCAHGRCCLAAAIPYIKLCCCLAARLPWFRWIQNRTTKPIQWSNDLMIQWSSYSVIQSYMIQSYSSTSCWLSYRTIKTLTNNYLITCITFAQNLLIFYNS